MNHMEKGIFLKKKFIIALVFLVVLLISPPLYYFYREYNKMYGEYQKTRLQLNKSSAQLGGENTQAIIDKVNKLIELPKETPTVASITDKTKLKNQPFFARAQNGDKVLVYQNAKKAIIYREAINKIIEVGTININEGTPTTETSLIVTPTATVTPTFKITPTKAL